MSIEKLYNMGDDALTNLFDISIDPISFIDDLASTLVRVQNLTIPATGANVYEVHYKTQMITKPGGKVDAPNEFTFDFRVDRNWLIYKGFVAWKNAVANSYTGAIGPDSVSDNYRVNLTAWAVAPDGSVIPNFERWRFVGCFCQNVGDIGFDYTTGDPLILTVTMGFLALDDTVL
jgi:hypothetical protein